MMLKTIALVLPVGLLLLGLGACASAEPSPPPPTAEPLPPPPAEPAPPPPAEPSPSATGGDTPLAPVDEVTDYLSLISTLRAAGAVVEPVGDVSQPFFTGRVL